jgi:hypothetical protein
VLVALIVKVAPDAKVPLPSSESIPALVHVHFLGSGVVPDGQSEWQVLLWQRKVPVGHSQSIVFVAVPQSQ